MGAGPPLGSPAILGPFLARCISNYCHVACLSPHEIFARVTASGPLFPSSLSVQLPPAFCLFSGRDGFEITLWLTAKHVHTLWLCLQLPKLCLSFLQGQPVGAQKWDPLVQWKETEKSHVCSYLAVGPQEVTSEPQFARQ